MGNNWKQFKKLAKELDLPEKLSYQWARHSFATNLTLAEGISERSIQESMGHTSITTTRNYIDSLVDEERDAIKDALMPDLGDEFNPKIKIVHFANPSNTIHKHVENDDIRNNLRKNWY